MEQNGKSIADRALSTDVSRIKIIEDSICRECPPWHSAELNEKYSYHLRASAPIAGAAEDPVCGTGNGSVASFIIHNRLIECNENINLIGEEGHEVNRPGCVYVSISNQNNEIKIGGTGVTVLEGKLIF